MNNKRMYLALFLAVTMGLSMFFLPMAPVTRTEISTPPAFTPEEVEQIEDFYEQVNQPGFTPEVDALLAAWQSGEALDTRVVAVGGKPSVLIFGAPWVDIESIRQVVDLNWWVDLKLFKVVKAVLPDAAALDLLLAVDGISTISADKAPTSVNEGIVTPVAPVEEPSLDMTELRDVVGATGTVASGYTGAGVLVGHVDTGGDFGQPDLQAAYSADSYDPTGQGVIYTNMHGNTTNVANATKWLEDGNILTFTNATGTYLNISLDIDPLCNYMALNILSPQYYVYYTSGLNTTYARNFFRDYIWKPVKVPAPSAIVGDYHWGFALQSRPNIAGGGPRIFTPVLVYNDTITHKWTTAIDWDGAWVWSNFFNGGWRYQTWNFGYQSYRDKILAVLDNSFVDDIAEEVYTLTNPNIAHDYTGDGVDDYTIGSLCWVYDSTTNATGSMGAVVLPKQTVFHGFRTDGNAIAVYFDAGTHGTATAAHVAAAGTHNYYDTNTKTTFQMKGIAPGAKIMSAKAITSGADYGSYLWVCGFDYNQTTDAFYYTGNHRADLVTNSWGWITEPSSQFNYLAFTWEILSTPQYLSPSYPGVLHVFSAGNEGEGFMTIGPPGATTAVLTVGASTSNKWLEYLYGPDQDIQGIASFSSKGPDFDGYPKPDVLAPGAAAYSATPLWAPYWVPQWKPGSSSANYTLFSGTSQSAPVAAGVAALLIEALENRPFVWDPMDVKTIIQNTADDMGYDPATQGFGRINADAACDFAENDVGLWTWNYDSYHINAHLMDEAWSYWGIIPGIGAEVNQTITKLSDAIVADGAIYFGAVLPGDVVTVHQTIYSALGGPVVTAPGWTTAAAYMREAERATFTGVTFTYNDTVMKNNQMYGFYNLRDKLTPATYDSAFGAYTYVTVGVSFKEADVSGNEPWMFLYDWTDNDPNDLKPNLWNATADLGDELTRLTSAQNPSNTNMMPFATNAASLGDALDGNMTLIIHDPVHDANKTASGHSFVCTVIFWEEAAATEIGIVEDDVYTYNFTLTVPGGAEAGIHQGFISVDSGALRIPYSYNVVADLAAAETAVNTIVDGYGAELSPYDSAMYGCMGFDTGTWDYRSYIIRNTHATAKYLGIRVIWDDKGNDMYVALLTRNNSVVVEGAMSTSTTTALIATLPTLNTGYFYMLMYPQALNGTAGLPVEYTVEIMWYATIPGIPSELQFSSRSNDLPTPVAITPDSTIVGDHVVLNGTYPVFALANLPEYEVDSITISFLSGLYATKTGPLVVPPSSYDPFSGTIVLANFAWCRIDGIIVGDNVAVTVGFTNGDCDIMMWWADTDNSTWTYGNNLMGAVMATGAKPEHGHFTATQSGSIMIGIFNYDGATGSYTVTVDTRVGVDHTHTGRTVTYDTYQFLKNGTFSVKISATTPTNMAFEVEFGNLRFENFFTPKLTGILVAGAGVVKTITWNCSDRNAGDDLYYEIAFSADNGLSYQLLAVNLTATNYTWNSAGFLARNTYKIRVVVYDNDPNEGIAAPGSYWMGLSDTIYSGSFSAGDVTTTTTTPPTTSTTTTTTTPVVQPTIDPLLIGLFGGIGVGVVVILILFLVRKK